MWLSDVSVKRPVLATVLNLLLVVFGVFALQSLSVREFPDIDAPVVSVSTNYLGASATVVENQITQLIEDRISGIEGVRRITSRSEEGESNVTIEFNLSRDIDAAANDVRDRVSRVLGNLPDEADPPEVTKADSDAQPILWLVLTSDRLNSMELSDYAARYLEDRFATVDGVSEIRTGGDRRYSMRIWLDRQALAARGLTVEDVEEALTEQNVERPAGRLESTDREFTLRTARPFETVDDFSNLIVATGADGFPIRLSQVAEVEIGPVEPRGEFQVNGVNALGLGIIRQSTANTLDVARGVREVIQQVSSELPEGTELSISYDSSLFVEASLHEVVMTLFYASILVIGVIWLFLGNWKATLIPAVTVPISLVTSFIFLQVFGFSINILTMLALVLAIGLVVDDAIVVVENIHRRLELGEPPLLAAFRGTREVAFAVIATTGVLVAVLAPITVLQGNVGRLFSEFALALAGAVVCSAVVALSLSPALAATLLRHNPAPGGFLAAVDRNFDRLAVAYKKVLGQLVRRAWVAVPILAALVGGSVLLLNLLETELTPAEDRGGFFVRVVGPQGASIGYTMDVMEQVEQPLLREVAEGDINYVLMRVPGFGSDEVNQGIFIVSTKPWDERERSAKEIGDAIDREVSGTPGARVVVQQRGGLGFRFGQPVEVVIGGPSYELLAEWQDRVMARLGEYPGLIRLDTDFKRTKPQIEIDIDVQRAADLGVPVLSVSQALETFFGGRRVTTYLDRGEEYDVILQAPDSDRRDPSSLTDVYVRSSSGSLVPLSNLIRTVERAAAPEYTRVDRMRSVTLSANLAPGYALGEVLDEVERVIRDELPESARVSWSGESRDFKESSQALYLTFGLALLIVYLVLAAQFESFVHPVAILTTVPLAVFGALGGLLLSGMTLNIYSQIGIIMLVGLAAKNGILIVEFINQRRDAGMPFNQAVLEASSVRLRPILMTSIATIAGAVPLILTGGAGAESRQILGVVIFFGVAASTLLTLFVVPLFYELICRRTGSPGRHEAALEKQAEAIPERPAAEGA